MNTTTNCLAKLVKEALGSDTLETLSDGLINMTVELDEKIESGDLAWGDKRIAIWKRDLVRSLISELEQE